MKLPVAETLDVCMGLMFNYFYLKLNSESKTPQSEQKIIEKSIFEYFDEHILKTHNSKHVHFIFFYIASFKVIICKFNFLMFKTDEFLEISTEIILIGIAEESSR